MGRQDGSSPASSQTEMLKTKRWENRVLSHSPPTGHCPLPIFGDSHPSLGPCRKGSGLFWVLLTQITPPAPHPIQAHLANLRLLLKASSAPPQSIPQRHLLIFPSAGHHSCPTAPHPWPLRPTQQSCHPSGFQAASFICRSSRARAALLLASSHWPGVLENSLASLCSWIRIWTKLLISLPLKAQA